jgi:diguanylate cyclase (GGDEF)-like protein/PAS domain S-box-containing protein
MQKGNRLGIDVLDQLSREELIEYALNADKKLETLSYSIDAQKYELQESTTLLNQYRQAVDSSSMLLIFNTKGHIIYVNRAFCNAMGYKINELINKKYTSLIKTNTKESKRGLFDTLRDKSTYSGTLQTYSKDGVKKMFSITIIPFLDIDKNIKKYIAVCHDVTEYYEQKRVIEKQFRDELTGFYNRQKLLEDIDRSDDYISLAIINISVFREFNDLYGHEFGDKILIAVANQIRSILTSNDIVIYKLPADEYAVLYKCSDTRLFEEKMKDLSYRISKDSIDVESQELHLSVSIGIAHSKTNILSKADIALSDAKKFRQEVLVYDVAQEVEKKYENNIHWIRNLKDAIESDRIIAYYQPILNNQTGKIEKFESLVRMVDESGKIITPYFFLEVSKTSRFYNKLTQKMIEQSFERFRDSEYEFSINFSIEDIQNSDTVEYLFDKLESFSDPKRVIIEITESEGIHNYSQVAEFIKELHKYGSKVAIDDFGTGYSNFDRILKLNVDYIKIDGSLVSDINKNESLKIICETIVMFAKRLGIKIVAEFVSDEGIQNQILDMGIEYSQGYYIDKPRDNIDIK